jgi:hypothetical protein
MGGRRGVLCTLRPASVGSASRLARSGVRAAKIRDLRAGRLDRVTGVPRVLPSGRHPACWYVTEPSAAGMLATRLDPVELAAGDVRGLDRRHRGASSDRILITSLYSAAVAPRQHTACHVADPAGLGHGQSWSCEPVRAAMTSPGRRGSVGASTRAPRPGCSAPVGDATRRSDGSSSRLE